MSWPYVLAFMAAIAVTWAGYRIRLSGDAESIAPFAGVVIETVGVFACVGVPAFSLVERIAEDDFRVVVVGAFIWTICPAMIVVAVKTLCRVYPERPPRF